MERNVYGSHVPNDADFRAKRNLDITAMGQDQGLRDEALALQSRAEAYSYGYQQEWCGVPIIRLPDDIVVLHEIVWCLRPGFIVETGVARGGSLVLSASLMAMAQLPPRVLGLDIQILEHTRTALSKSPYSEFISLWEGDSSGDAASAEVNRFIQEAGASRPGLLVLDSDHSESHVLRELESLATRLPVGSLVLVADTLIEEFPSGHYPDRPWDRGNSPLSAVRSFLKTNPNFRMSEQWARRGLITEFREGILERL